MSQNKGHHGTMGSPNPLKCSTAIAPTLPQAPVQAEPVAELMLVHIFGISLLLFWRARIDSTIVRRFAGWVAPGLSKTARQQASEVFDPANDETQATADSPAMLEAATRWYVGLQLPRT
jgi:hypothetical protein